MPLISSVFHSIDIPSAKSLGRSPLEFLRSLMGPAHIHVRGRDSSRSRVVVTLLHGNEPSGLNAIFNMLSDQILPAVDIHYFIPSVAAALEPPCFSYRMLPGRRDLNRCFQPPYEDEVGRLASALLSEIRAIGPEAVIDIHNTSGEGPSFAVTTHMDERHDALVSLFTQRLIVTDLRLGALMEISEHLCPTVTIECGGAQSENSSLIATEGLHKFICQEDVLTPQGGDVELDYYHNPIRLELSDKINCKISFGTAAADDGHLVLAPDIEKYNFNVVNAQVDIAYLSTANLESLSARDAQGFERRDAYFHCVNGRLRPKMALKFFMVTSQPDIARSDCLLYFVEA